MELPELTWEDKEGVEYFHDTGYAIDKLVRQKQKQTAISDFLT